MQLADEAIEVSDEEAGEGLSKVQRTPANGSNQLMRPGVPGANSLAVGTSQGRVKRERSHTLDQGTIPGNGKRMKGILPGGHLHVSGLSPSAIEGLKEEEEEGSDGSPVRTTASPMRRGLLVPVAPRSNQRTYGNNSRVTRREESELSSSSVHPACKEEEEGSEASFRRP